MSQLGLFSLLIHSLERFFKLIILHNLHQRSKRLREIYRLQKRGVYTIFRETVNDEKRIKNQVILVVGFRLRLIRSVAFFHWLFQRLCILTTPFWSGFPGFHIKLWMVATKTQNYAGIYEWYGKQNAAAYLRFLLPVLRFFSVKGSVWYTTIQGKSLALFLHSSRKS